MDDNPAATIRASVAPAPPDGAGQQTHDPASPYAGTNWISKDDPADHDIFDFYTTKILGDQCNNFFRSSNYVHSILPVDNDTRLRVQLHDRSELTCHSQGIDFHNEHTPFSVQFAVEKAQAMGWTKLNVEGTDEFRLTVQRALAQVGIIVLNALPEPQPAAATAPPPQAAARPRGRPAPAAA